MPEDMFWVRQGRHYGFPWIAGGIEMPQQYNDYQPDPATDKFIPSNSAAWSRRLMKNDPGFPKKPEGVKFSPGVQNFGPDANEYRGHSGKVMDGDLTAQAVSTFTPHASPLGLVFDTKNVLAPQYRGDGFVLRYSKGSMMARFTSEGSDMLHLDMAYDKLADNFFMRTTRIIDGLRDPVDTVMVGNVIYVIEHGTTEGNIWKVTLPGVAKPAVVKK
jgi:glucose/arabinose dehydrogenase